MKNEKNSGSGLPIPVYFTFALFAVLIVLTIYVIIPFAKAIPKGSKQPCLFHEWQEATCVKPETCKKCGATRGVPLGEDHIWGDWEEMKPPSCNANGYATRECSRCHERETKRLEMLEHDYGEWKVESNPTCETEGAEARICRLCGEKETRPVPALEHEPKKEWVDLGQPAEDKCGIAELCCKLCGEVLQEIEYSPELAEQESGSKAERSNTIGGFKVCGTMRISGTNTYVPILADYNAETIEIGLCVSESDLPESLIIRNIYGILYHPDSPNDIWNLITKKDAVIDIDVFDKGKTQYTFKKLVGNVTGEKYTLMPGNDDMEIFAVKDGDHSYYKAAIYKEDKNA